jgi:hypothetical protein
MTRIAEDLLTTFKALPADEQHAVAVAIIRSVSGTASTLSDDMLTALADEVFISLDEEEARHADSPAE